MAHRLEHRDVDAPALAGGVALVERGEDAEGGIEAVMASAMAGPMTRGRSGGTTRRRKPLAACATVSKAGLSFAGPLTPKPEMAQ